MLFNQLNQYKTKIIWLQYRKFVDTEIIFGNLIYNPLYLSYINNYCHPVKT